MILYEKTLKELGHEFDSCGVWKEFFCTCDYCGIEFKRSKRSINLGRKIIQKESCNSKDCVRQKREESQFVKYGVKNAGGSQSSLEKAKLTWMKNYGCDNPMGSQAVRDKVAATCLERYGSNSFLSTEECQEIAKQEAQKRFGVDNFSQAQEVKDKTKETCHSKYGCDHYSQTEEWKKAVKDTCQEKWGVDNYSQTEECQKLIEATNLENLGVERPLQSPQILDKLKKTCLERYKVEHYSQTEEFKKRHRETSLRKYGTDSPMQNKEVLQKMIDSKIEKYGTLCLNFGKTENEIKDFLKENGFEFESNYDLVPNKEIDLFNDELKLAIEYCGLRFHSECSPEPRLRNYHYDKYKSCKDKGVKLITIFEDEWVKKKQQCKNILLSSIGKYGRRIMARKCKLLEIDKIKANEFYEHNHLLGKGQHNVINFGLINEDELVACLSLSKHHRKKGMVINRLCFKNFVQVVGGFGKLLSACLSWSKQNNVNKIITWSDNRWSDGKVYEKLNFTLEAELPPDYSYVDCRKKATRASKQSQKKSKTGCPANKTEREFAIENNLFRIWDCGKKRWTISP